MNPDTQIMISFISSVFIVVCVYTIEVKRRVLIQQNHDRSYLTESPPESSHEPRYAPKDESMPPCEEYDFRSAIWTSRSGTKRYALFNALKREQGNKPSISLRDCRKIALKLPQEELPKGVHNFKREEVKGFIDSPSKSRGYIQKDGVKKVYK